MENLRINIDAQRSVSALLVKPSDPLACFVFAHGAGAGMNHPFMDNMASALFDRSLATLRYQFPSMEAHAKRPDPPAVAQATVRAAVGAARQHCPNLMLIAGGKSFGGRMTSQAQAALPLPNVAGLVFFGFPLHASGKPSTERAAHLFKVTISMLFLQGDKDKLAESPLIRTVTEELGARATLHVIGGADHSFHVPKRSGRPDADVINEMADVVVAWLRKQFIR
jgi:predicted alpha/beta-hydrolase family hydrolase